ncbi:ubiquitin carboxyl-terminal hydrolase MINDY-3 isoform X2 [Xiphophorus couchianus]|uniref:ubiquitin carboxyl-terminal hydrolase MINDY-3 isoform X2 n=1 Tax=Xiphophorus couchianus TaxID=32473 RepID=UPI00101634E9|nr:ubiquitin carboxyl-terminal hydrolase MINDY-3 isoform X2 [Xiphophorus couchianus]
MPQVHTALGSGVLRFGRDFIKNRQPLLSLHDSRTEEGVTKDLKPIMSELNKEMVDLVWGKPSGGGVSTSIFRRWSQGFVFSEHEQTALKQFEGGPCAVIAPVQAFLLKNILFNREHSTWRQMSEEEQKMALCSTLSEILESACASPSTGFCFVTWAKGQSPYTSTLSKTQTQSQTQDMPRPESSQSPQEQQPTALAAEDLGFEQFHSVLHKRTVLSVSDLREEVLSLYQSWRGCCGVLLFLYSVILTKGIENIRNEIQDPTEPLIDPIHGHGSQSLVNLLITGHAVSNVWDGDRECSGMKLHGIHKQASVGFLTLMESLRYCKEMSLVGPESPSEQARRVFQSFDPEDNGFIPESLLEDVMKALDLVSEPEYVSLVKSKLDPESLGIILLGPFLLEFFPDQDSGIPDSFPIYHYNGLKQSNHKERVEYVEGTALVLGFEDPMVRTDDTPVKRCLQTKWPYIELLWATNLSPSMN